MITAPISSTPCDPLTERIAQAKTQLAGMRAKHQRLADAIRQREESLSRLEANAALNRATPPDRSHHE